MMHEIETRYAKRDERERKAKMIHRETRKARRHESE